MYWEKRLERQFNLRGVGLSNASVEYNKWLYKARERSLTRVLNSYSVPVHGKNVMDVGCGTGYWVDYFDRRGACITGIDITKTSVTHLQKKHPKHIFLRADIGEHLDTGRKFDIITVFDVLYHVVDSPKFQVAIQNIAEAANDSAWVFITDLFPRNDLRLAPHVYCRSLDTYRYLLQKNNLHIIDLIPVFCVLFRSTRIRLLRPFFGKSMMLSRIWGPVGYVIDGILIKLPFPNRLFSGFILVARKQEAPL